MSKRHVKTPAAALAQTTRPVRDAAPVPRVTGARLADGLQNLVAGLNSDRDKSSFSTYLQLGFGLNDQTLAAMFRGSPVARNIVEMPADDMTRAWVKLNWDKYDADKNGVKAVEDAAKQFALRTKTNWALKMGRLYGGSVIVVGLKGDDPSMPIGVTGTTPKDRARPPDYTKIKKSSLQYLHVLEKTRISPVGALDKSEGPNFGLPALYRIAESSVEFHWSRVIRFGGAKLPYFDWQQRGFWDDSVLQCPYDIVRAYDQTMGGVASLVWEASVDILTSPGLADMLAENGGEAKVASRYQSAFLLKSLNRTLILDGGPVGDPLAKGETYEQKTITFAGLTDVVRDARVDVAGASRIPLTKLFGQSATGLSATGEGDLKNYDDSTMAAQESDLRSPLERLYEVVTRSALGRMPENFCLEFNPLRQQTSKEIAEENDRRADTDKKYIDMGVLTEGSVAAELYDRKTYRTMEEEDVAAAEELADEPDPIPPAAGGAPQNPAAAPAPGAMPPGEAPKTKASDADIGDVIKREPDGWHVYSEHGDKHLGGPYGTMRAARKRLRQVEYFRRNG